jgi:hypothetical protein
MDQLLQAQDAACARPPAPHGALGLDEVTSRTTVVKCMGRTYGATSAQGTAVAISDITDITRPVPLGDALQDGTGAWEVRSSSGRSLTSARDLLHAVAVLREFHWPPRDLR